MHTHWLHAEVHTGEKTISKSKKVLYLDVITCDTEVGHTKGKEEKSHKTGRHCKRS